ncbi:MAG: response regulator [Elusimicrobiota bacterium]|nr:response regulator [Elusimicrobiota bacterium]
MAKKILLIEDDRSVCELLSHILNGKGYQTIIAFTGKDGLKICKNVAPNLIILDVLLPDINGFEVLKAVKSNEETKSIPVLMLTEKNLLGDVEHAISLGANGYITKPFDIQRLLEKVAELL